MEQIIANFCDDQLLFYPGDYTDETNNVLLEKLAEEFSRDYCHDWDEMDRKEFGNSFDEIITQGVRHWWESYPSAFKYNGAAPRNAYA